ncbi:MAG TPA: hypothetical protein PK679_09215, partial [Methanolinea sp.]|nr:hypothetical protein [Methanolinea sp.]
MRIAMYSPGGKSAGYPARKYPLYTLFCPLPVFGSDHPESRESPVEVLFSVAEQFEGLPVCIGQRRLPVHLEDDLGCHVC